MGAGIKESVGVMEGVGGFLSLKQRDRCWPERREREETGKGGG